MHRTLAPVSLSSTLACCAVSQTFQRLRFSSLPPMNANTCSKAIRACSKDDATITVSPRGTARGPSNVAAAIPLNSAVLPLPRPTDSAADCVPGANAPRTKRACYGSTRNACPARRPCVTVRPDR